MYRQQKLLEKLLRFRFKKHSFDLIKVEVYDCFDGDSYKCRLEIFKGGTGVGDRIMKYEGKLTETFVIEVEERLAEVIGS